MHAKSCKSHCNGGVKVALGGLRRCARGKCMQRVANRIVTVVSKWLWVVGLRRCARGKCMQRVPNRNVMVVSRWLWVVGVRRCARGKCMQRIANRIVTVVSRWLWVVGLQRCARGKAKSGKLHCNGRFAAFTTGTKTFCVESGNL